VADSNKDAALRKRWGLAPDDPAPASGEKILFKKGQARKLEAERQVAAQKAKAISIPGLSQEDIDRKLDASAQRAKLRQRDFFSIPVFDNRIELALKSLPGARNDVKKRNDKFQKAGNNLFGAEAAAAGLSEKEALFWGAFAQPFQDMLKGQWPSWHDNEGDPEAIREGHRYFYQRRRK